MKFNWGWGIALFYSGFVVLIVGLVIGANRQEVDLVSNDYYGEELAYQKVIESSKNQAALSKPVEIRATADSVCLHFPPEFQNKALKGKLTFYAPSNPKWDHDADIAVAGNSSFAVSRKGLQHTKFVLKINWTADGREYYQETDLPLF
jgi:hypothetical protein